MEARSTAHFTFADVAFLLKCKTYMREYNELHESTESNKGIQFTLFLYLHYKTYIPYKIHQKDHQIFSLKKYNISCFSIYTTKRRQQ